MMRDVAIPTCCSHAFREVTHSLGSLSSTSAKLHNMPSGGPLSSTDSDTGVPALFVCFSGTMGSPEPMSLLSRKQFLPYCLPLQMQLRPCAQPQSRHVIDPLPEITKLLRSHCFDCHGADAPKGEFSLEQLIGSVKAKLISGQFLSFLISQAIQPAISS